MHGTLYRHGSQCSSWWLGCLLFVCLASTMPLLSFKIFMKPTQRWTSNVLVWLNPRQKYGFHKAFLIYGKSVSEHTPILPNTCMSFACSEESTGVSSVARDGVGKSRYLPWALCQGYPLAVVGMQDRGGNQLELFPQGYGKTLRRRIKEIHLEVQEGTLSSHYELRNENGTDISWFYP